MLPGPVFNAELITSARRARYYVIRFVYGMILLFLVAVNFPRHWSGIDSGEVSIQEMARIGQGLFAIFATVQAVAVVALTPALVAGAIADEKQRKTLHYLLASRLSSGEIVLGKLAARLLHVGVFLAIGLPILSLLSLFGGVDPWGVVAYTAATVSTALFLSALSILVSTHARRPREAISTVYTVSLFWLFVPPLVRAVGPSVTGWFWQALYPWIEPINDWVSASSPMTLLWIAPRMAMGPGWVQAFAEALFWMIGLQLGAGALMVLLAVARLRPIFRKEGGRGRWAARMADLRRGRRFLARPECGDDAMLWKERYVSRTGLATKVAWGLVALVGGGVLLYATYEYARPAFAELWANGYSSSGGYRARQEFNQFLRILGALLYVAWALAIASSASSGLTSEREQDTWISLVATPLDGLEIVRGKMIGAVWATRHLGFVVLGLWLVGLASGAVHPLGLVAVLLDTAIYLWFAAALGTFASLHSRTTTRALATTVATLIVVNGAYMMCCIPIADSISFFATVGMTPMVEGMSLLSYEDVNDFFGGGGSGIGNDRMIEMVSTCVFSPIIYGVAAFALTGLAIAQFDEVVDRPRRGPGEGPGAVRPITFIEDEPGAED